MPKKAGDFNEEVARLGNSQKFIDFLNERSRGQKKHTCPRNSGAAGSYHRELTRRRSKMLLTVTPVGTDFWLWIHQNRR